MIGKAPITSLGLSKRETISNEVVIGLIGGLGKEKENT